MRKIFFCCYNGYACFGLFFFSKKKLFIKNNYKTVRVNLSILKLNVEDTNFVI